MKTVRLFVNDNETSKNVSKIVKEKLESANFQIVEDDHESFYLLKLLPYL